MYTRHLWHLNHMPLQTAGWLSRCHWPQNKQHEITQKASSPFFFSFQQLFLLLFVKPEQWLSRLKRYTSGAAVQWLNADEKDAPKDCRSNRVFQTHHHHRPPLTHLMQCPNVLENNQYSRHTFWKTTPKCKNHFLGIKKILLVPFSSHCHFRHHFRRLIQKQRN